MEDFRTAKNLQELYVRVAALFRERGIVREDGRGEYTPDELFKAFFQAFNLKPKFERQIEELKAQVSRLQGEISEMQGETAELVRQVDGIEIPHQMQISQLKKQIRGLETELEGLKAQLEREKETVRQKASENFMLTQEHEEDMAALTTQQNEYEAAIQVLWMKIQGYMAVWNISLDEVGITPEERQLLQRRPLPDTQDISDAVDRLGDETWEEPPVKLGVTVPPSQIREAPTVPPRDEDAIPTIPPEPEPHPTSPPMPLTRRVTQRAGSISMPSLSAQSPKTPTPKTLRLSSDSLSEALQEKPPTSRRTPPRPPVDPDEPVLNAELGRTAEWKDYVDPEAEEPKKPNPVPPPESDPQDIGRVTRAMPAFHWEPPNKR
jgi:hypothetical protein